MATFEDLSQRDQKVRNSRILTVNKGERSLLFQDYVRISRNIIPPSLLGDP